MQLRQHEPSANPHPAWENSPNLRLRMAGRRIAADALSGFVQGQMGRGGSAGGVAISAREAELNREDDLYAQSWQDGRSAPASSDAGMSTQWNRLSPNQLGEGVVYSDSHRPAGGNYVYGEDYIADGRFINASLTASTGMNESLVSLDAHASTPSGAVSKGLLNGLGLPDPQLNSLDKIVSDAISAANMPDDGLPASSWDTLRRDSPSGIVRENGRSFYLSARDPNGIGIYQANDLGSTNMLAWGSKVSPEFRIKTIQIAQNLGTNPDYLMAAMAFETGGTFSPSIKNGSGSGATGLIQFMPSTAIGLGTTTDALSKMTAEQQLGYVEQYFSPYQGKLNSLPDVYMAILLPSAIGKPDDYVLFDQKAKPKAYTQNKGLDINGNGEITKAEATAKVQVRLTLGRSSENAK